MEPGWTIVGKESFTEQYFECVNRTDVFVIIRMILLKDMFGVIGMSKDGCRLE